jgi:hypothetical protein
MDETTRANLLSSLLTAELDTRPSWVLQLVTLEARAQQLWLRPQQLATDVAAAVLASSGSSSGHLQALEELLQVALEAVGSGSSGSLHGQEGAVVAATQALAHAEGLVAACKVLSKYEVPTSVGGWRLPGWLCRAMSLLVCRVLSRYVTAWLVCPCAPAPAHSRQASAASYALTPAADSPLLTHPC